MMSMAEQKGSMFFCEGGRCESYCADRRIVVNGGKAAPPLEYAGSDTARRAVGMFSTTYFPYQASAVLL
jgi:hypothetical protein